MKRIFALMFFMTFFVSCNKDGAITDCATATEAQAESSSNPPTECTITDDSTVTGETSGGTSGSTTAGSSTGSTTGGTTGSTTGRSTGSTTGSTAGGTAGGTSGGAAGTSAGGTNGAGTDGSLPTQAFTFDTNIEFINTTATQEEKFDQAIEIIKKVVATEEFRNQVLNHTYNGSKTYVDNGGFTNAQIYQKILDGAETLSPAKNNTIDMEVELYYAATTTVGYTYPNVTKIWVNTKYFNTNPVTSVAANLMHEWLHKVGFKHAVSHSTSRNYSVPYAIGKMISTLGKQFD